MDKQLKVYHYPPCSTCKLANKGLKQHGYELDLHDIKAMPPSAEELTDLIRRSGLPLQKWFNTSGEVYREMGLKDKLKGMTEGQKIKLLSEHGMLIKRPIVDSGDRVTIGFREPDFGGAWYNS